VLEINEKTSMVNVTNLCSVDVLKQFIFMNAEYILALSELENIENLIKIPGFDVFKNAAPYTGKKTCWLNKFIAVKLAFYINPSAVVYWKLC
jgi:hypothetical protein